MKICIYFIFLVVEIELPKAMGISDFHFVDTHVTSVPNFLPINFTSKGL